MAEEIIIEKKSPQITKIILAVLISALVFGLLGYYLGKRTKTEVPATPVAQSMAIEEREDLTSNVTATPVAADNTYKDSLFGFTFDLNSTTSVMRTESYEGAKAVQLQLGEKSTDNVSTNTQIRISCFDYKGVDYSLGKADSNYRQENANDILNASDIKIDGKDAKKYEVGGMMGGYHIISVNDEKEYQIDVYPSNDKNIKLINEIIESFKF